MKNFLFIVSLTFMIIIFSSVIAQETSLLTEKEYMNQLKKAEDAFRNYLPKLDLLENEYLNDSEFLIGSALLYSKYSNSEGIQKKIERQWEKVLAIDPDNKVALATTVKDVQFYPERLSSIYDELDRRIDSAKERGSGSVTIKYQTNYGPDKIVEKNGEKILQPAQISQSRLYKYFSKGDNKDIVISDFESAEVQLKAKLNVELAESLDLIDNAENRDPNNALYNYLKAHIFFKLGYNDFGLDQIRNGSKKEYLKTYYPEIRQSVSNVLELIDVPESMRQFITPRYSSTGYFIMSKIIAEDLNPLINEYYEQKNVQPIKEIFNIASIIAQQLRKEPMPNEAMQKGQSEVVEKWIETKRNELSLKE